MKVVSRCHARLRKWVRRWLIQRRTEDYAPPIVSDVLDDVPDGQPNLLPVTALAAPLRVEIPMWPISLPSEDDPETLTFYWNGVLHTTKTFTSKVPASELIIEVSTEYLLHGRPALHYQVQIYNGEVGASEVLKLTIDRQAPELGGDEGMLSFPDDVLENGVTAYYLTLNNDVLEAGVPAYSSPEVGDRVAYYWNRKLNDEELVGERTLTLEDLGKSLTLTFDGEMIREREDGVRYAYYRIEDRAGNKSPRARIVDHDVAAAIVPRVLPWPDLPKASGAGATVTLDLKTLTGELFCVLPAAAEIYPEDTVTLQWGVPGEVGSLTLAESGVKGQFVIPRDKLAMQSGKTLPFYYQVKMFDGTVVESISPHRQVTVLRYAPYRPVPQIREATVGYLKLSDVINNAHLRIETWTYISTDHYLKLQLKGVNMAGAGVVFDVEPAYQVTEEDITRRLIGVDDRLVVPKPWLETLRSASTLQLTATVSFDRGQSWPPAPNLGTLTVQLLG